ncbi:hypothetical protein CLLI_22540 [Clostridium liquoris]|jgi:hypothetical protein|uniref:Phage head-tail joining protein n=1 Tax=Clostridium liquoris TaxID=1289519 RepID=A0A2T0B209_9CLOT|nr:hypothetical protein [Clostridium liquoris]PRR77690.1 hypothetical protein CLLI_22540 [Clostridium liquoris]
MSGINRAKISQRIYKQLYRKGLLKEIRILRNGKNAYGEKLEDLYVTTINGYYYREKSKINISPGAAATVTANCYDKLLIAYSEESKKIKKDDYFILDGAEFRIIDPNNIENIVLDMYLDRM